MNSRRNTTRTRDRTDWDEEWLIRRTQAAMSNTATAKPTPAKPASQETKMDSAEVKGVTLEHDPKTQQPTGIMYTNISCGVQYLYGIHPNPEEALKNAFDWSSRYNNHKCAFYIFSDHNRVIIYGKGQKREFQSAGDNAINLAKYIQEQGLGTITTSGEAFNPNSSNKIQVFIWQVDHPALVKWCNDRGISCCNNVQQTAEGSTEIKNNPVKPVPKASTEGTAETKPIAQGVSVRLRC